MTERGNGMESAGLNLLIGAAAGAAAVYVFDKLDWFMYEHEDDAATAQTKAARPGGEAPAHVMATRASKVSGLGAAPKEKLGTGIHYGLGVGPGAAYGLLRRRLPLVSAGRGTLFGLAMFLVEDELLNTLMRTAGKPQDYPWQAHARGLVSHLVYGFVLDTLLRTADSVAEQRAKPASY